MSFVENSAKAIIIKDGSILLIKNKDVAGLGVWYSLPGGRQRFGENLHQAIVREVLEETGYEIEVGKLAFVREYVHLNHELRFYGKPSHKIEFMFECKFVGVNSSEPQERILDDEQETVVWYDLASLDRCNILPRRLRRLSTFSASADIYWGDILNEV